MQRRSSSHNLRQSAPSFGVDAYEPTEIEPDALQEDDDEEDEITSPDTFAARERVRTSEVFLKVR